jgi:carbonic anhydrase
MSDDPMERLKAGVARFQEKIFPEQWKLFQDLATRQHPQILFLTCADSRVNPNLITQTGPGELFICRNIGNVVPPHGTQDGSVATVMEYAVEVLGVEHIIVCGHSNCGAIKSLLDPNDDSQVPQVTDWLRYAEVARRVAHSMHERNLSSDLLITATEQNVLAQLNHLRTYPEIAARLSTRRLQLHGWYYDIASGRIDEYDPQAGVFVPLVREVQSKAQVS